MSASPPHMELRIRKRRNRGNDEIGEMRELKEIGEMGMRERGKEGMGIENGNAGMGNGE